MKKMIVLFGIFSVLLLSACSEKMNVTETDNSNASEKIANDKTSKNLIDPNTLIDGQWIDFNGVEKASDKYVSTESIDYNPGNEYSINNGVYVSYFNDEEFIETIRFNEEGKLNQVEDSNNIKLSFHEQFKDIISLTQN